ncbi:hypothetical protein FRC02_010501, partial [Tulasnella sp. 418]
MLGFSLGVTSAFNSLGSSIREIAEESSPQSTKRRPSKEREVGGLSKSTTRRARTRKTRTAQASIPYKPGHLRDKKPSQTGVRSLEKIAAQIEALEEQYLRLQRAQQTQEPGGSVNGFQDPESPVSSEPDLGDEELAETEEGSLEDTLAQIEALRKEYLKQSRAQQRQQPQEMASDLQDEESESLSSGQETVNENLEHIRDQQKQQFLHRADMQDQESASSVDQGPVRLGLERPLDTKSLHVNAPKTLNKTTSLDILEKCTRLSLENATELS